MRAGPARHKSHGPIRRLYMIVGSPMSEPASSSARGASTHASAGMLYVAIGSAGSPSVCTGVESTGLLCAGRGLLDSLTVAVWPERVGQRSSVGFAHGCSMARRRDQTRSSIAAATSLTSLAATIDVISTTSRSGFNSTMSAPTSGPGSDSMMSSTSRTVSPPGSW